MEMACKLSPRSQDTHESEGFGVSKVGFNIGVSTVVVELLDMDVRVMVTVGGAVTMGEPAESVVVIDTTVERVDLA